MTRVRGAFEQGGGPFERAEASSGGVFEDWRQRGEDGERRDSVESQKTTTASPPFPHAIPEDVQFFEPSLVLSSYFFYQCPHWYTQTHYRETISKILTKQKRYKDYIPLQI